MACICITGAVRNFQTATIEVLLELTPIHIVVENVFQKERFIKICDTENSNSVKIEPAIKSILSKNVIAYYLQLKWSRGSHRLAIIITTWPSTGFQVTWAFTVTYMKTNYSLKNAAETICDPELFCCLGVHHDLIAEKHELQN